MLQDFSFRKTYFRKIMKYMYAASMLVFSLAGLFFIAYGFSHGTLFGVFALVLAPLAVLLGISLMRVTLEALHSMMRTSSYIREIAKNQRLMVAAAQEKAEPHEDQRSKIALLKQTGF